MHFQKFQVAFYNLSGDIDDEWWTLGGIHGTTFLKVWMDGSEVWMMHQLIMVSSYGLLTAGQMSKGQGVKT